MRRPEYEACSTLPTTPPQALENHLSIALPAGWLVSGISNESQLLTPSNGLWHSQCLASDSYALCGHIPSDQQLDLLRLPLWWYTPLKAPMAVRGSLTAVASLFEASRWEYAL